MPILDEATYSRRRDEKNSLKNPNGVTKTFDAPLLDLLDLCDEPAPPNSSGDNFLQDLLGGDFLSSSSHAGTSPPQKSGTAVLLDLVSTGSPPAQNGSPAADILSLSQDIKSSVSTLDSLSSPMVMAILVILVSLDSSEGSMGTHAGRAILFGTIPTTIPNTTPVITPPTRIQLVCKNQTKTHKP
nr:adaptor protein complex AP-1, gamma subunit [Tanacetum cinerariifolium]